MLVLSRKEQETIKIGNDITITVTQIGPGRVKIGIDAPDHVNIARGELEPEEGRHEGSQTARRVRQ